MDRKRLAQVAVEVLLTIGAVLGVLCVVSAVAGIGFGVTPLVIRSGSMSPGIPTGSLSLARIVPADELVPGDVVSVERTGGGRVTHRIASVQPMGDSVILVLKGDANRVADAEPYRVTEADRVFATIPGAGYVASWFATPSAKILVGVCALLVVAAVFRPRRTEPEESVEKRSAASSATVLTLVAVIVGTGAVQIRSTAAAFTDTAAANSNFSAHATFIPNPDTFSCSGLLGLTLSLSWPSRGAGFDYQLIFKSGGTQVGSPVIVGENTTPGATVSFTMVLNDLGLLSLGNYTVELRSRRKADNTVSPNAPLVLTINRALVLATCVAPTTVNNPEGPQGFAAPLAGARMAPVEESAPEESETATPETTAPETTDPATSEPETTSPETTTSPESTTSPETTTETTTSEEASLSIVPPEPPVAEPLVAEPTLEEGTTEALITEEPVTEVPVTEEPTTTDPPATEPTSTDPPATEPMPTEPPAPVGTVFSGSGNVVAFQTSSTSCTVSGDYSAMVQVTCGGRSFEVNGAIFTPNGVAAATRDGVWLVNLGSGSMEVVSALRS